MSTLTREDIEDLKFLSKTHRELHEQRRKYEFQAVFTSLSFFALSVAGFLGDKVKLPDSPGIKTGIQIMFLLVAVACAALLKRLHVSNRKNLDIARNAENEIVTALQGKGCHILEEWAKQSDCLSRLVGRWQSWEWQAAFLTITALTAGVIVRMK